MKIFVLSAYREAKKQKQAPRMIFSFVRINGVYKNRLPNPPSKSEKLEGRKYVQRMCLL